MNEETLFSRLAGIETTLRFMSDDIKKLHSENSDRRGDVNRVAECLREEAKTTTGEIQKSLSCHKEDIEKLKNDFGLIKWAIAIVGTVAITTFTFKVISLMNTTPQHEMSQEKSK